MMFLNFLGSLAVAAGAAILGAIVLAGAALVILSFFGFVKALIGSFRTNPTSASELGEMSIGQAA